MKPRTLRYRTYAEIADEMAKEHYNDLWCAYRNVYLEALIQDFWSGRFMDNAGQNCVFDLDPRQTGAPAPITREIVWRMLGRYKPQTVREVPEGSTPPYKRLGAAKIAEYGGTVVHDIFENHALSEADARAWTEQYDKENSPRIQVGTQHTPSVVMPEPADPMPSTAHPNRRGRKKGVGGYDSTDMPLIEKMHRLIKSGKARNPWGAALVFVDDAEGTESVINKQKRLTGKYVKKYGPGEGHSV